MSAEPPVVEPITAAATSHERLGVFVGGDEGAWRVRDIRTVIGEALPAVARVAVNSRPFDALSTGAAWSLRGITSNERYVTRAEKAALARSPNELGLSTATCAALIPVRKSAAWWSLAQDERRHIVEEQSHHIRIGTQYASGIARRLYHCRDLGGSEPFDFLTWFEYAPENTGAFDELVGTLRATPEWKYVEREVDIRLIR